MRFVVLMETSMNVGVFWGAAQCIVVDGDYC
jgi:hypothetical protein